MGRLGDSLKVSNMHILHRRQKSSALCSGQSCDTTMWPLYKHSGTTLSLITQSPSAVSRCFCWLFFWCGCRTASPNLLNHPQCWPAHRQRTQLTSLWYVSCPVPTPPDHPQLLMLQLLLVLLYWTYRVCLFEINGCGRSRVMKPSCRPQRHWMSSLQHRAETE